MLKLKYLFENFDLAKECLGYYEADMSSADEMFEYFRVSSNAVYPFREKGTGEVCFLRLSPAEEKSLKEVEWEIKLLEWLNAQGYPAMRPVYLRDGSPCRVVSTEWGRWNMACYRRVPGRTLEDIGADGLARGYGQLLGCLHSLFKSCPLDGRRDCFNLLDEAMARLRAYNAPESLLREWESLKGELDGLSKDASSYGIVHYDFETDNVLYSEKSGAFGVIDFDDAVRCWYALDVARALDCLKTENEAAEFMEGYRGETEFDGDPHALSLMRRLVAVVEYANILRALSEPVDDPPEWMEEITENLTNRMREIEENIG